MSHWHRCERWRRRDMQCPFGSVRGHEDDGPDGGPGVPEHSPPDTDFRPEEPRGDRPTLFMLPEKMSPGEAMEWSAIEELVTLDKERILWPAGNGHRPGEPVQPEREHVPAPYGPRNITFERAVAAAAAVAGGVVAGRAFRSGGFGGKIFRQVFAPDKARLAH